MDFSLNKNTKIYVAGHKGLIGSAFVRFFEKNNFTNIIVEDRKKLDLCSKDATFSFFQQHQPEVVILAAGKVGGIVQNRDFPLDFLNENLSMQINVFNSAREFKVKKLLFFGSSCMYPKNSLIPMKESQIFTGDLEQTSIAYATAKYSGYQMCQAINRQFNMSSFISVIPNFLRVSLELTLSTSLNPLSLNITWIFSDLCSLDHSPIPSAILDGILSSKQINKDPNPILKTFFSSIVLT